MRLVLDTNVLLAAIVAEGVCHDLVSRRVRTHELVSSQVLLDELDEKLRHKFRRDPASVPLHAAYLQRVELVGPVPLPAPVCRDAEDDWVLATALAGRAEIIVTGDDDLLVLKSHQGIRILSPRGFLEFLDRRP